MEKLILCLLVWTNCFWFQTLEWTELYLYFFLKKFLKIRKNGVCAGICFIWLTSLAVFSTNLSPPNTNMKLLCKLGKEWRIDHTAWQLRSSSPSVYILVDAHIVFWSSNGTDPVLKSTVSECWHLHRFHLELARKNSAQMQSHL